MCFDPCLCMLTPLTKRAFPPYLIVTFSLSCMIRSNPSRCFFVIQMSMYWCCDVLKPGLVLTASVRFLGNCFCARNRVRCEKVWGGGGGGERGGRERCIVAYTDTIINTVCFYCLRSRVAALFASFVRGVTGRGGLLYL